MKILSKNYAVCKLEKNPQVPQNAEFFSLSVTDKEISLVCDEKSVPKNC